MRIFFLLFTCFKLAAHTVIIDAGHGGQDRGTGVKTPFCEEKRVNLQTARLVRQYLEQLGYHVIMTRDNDSFVPLARRVEVAQQASSEIFVSIHYNFSRNPTAQGIEIFFCDARAQKQKTASSKKLAESILPRLIRRTSAISRGVKRGNYYVIRETTMPSVLIEAGFISNPLECARIKTPEYREKIARGIAEGVDSYFKKKRSRLVMASSN